jgi:hypothetical protein
MEVEYKTALGFEQGESRGRKVRETIPLRFVQYTVHISELRGSAVAQW